VRPRAVPRLPARGLRLVRRP
ncbi:MAG: hypothetical protein AVDCRST_MAG13-3586, partial [uncultured Solirubrobacteraceae bacterium]